MTGPPPASALGDLAGLVECGGDVDGRIVASLFKLAGPIASGRYAVRVGVCLYRHVRDAPGSAAQAARELAINAGPAGAVALVTGPRPEG